MTCPHADIVYCPLYRAAHEGHPAGCADGRLDEGGCAVARGMNYAAAVARLDRRAVAELAFREETALAQARRRRTMALLGVH